MSGEPSPQPRRDRIRDAMLGALITGAASLAGAWTVFGPFRTWVRYPLAYSNSGDALFNLWVVKTVNETGWFVTNPALGAPFGATLLDFARPEVLFLVMLRAAAVVSSNTVLIHNLFYFAGFVLVSWSALFVLRHELRLSWPLAIAGALTFSWLPYHFARIPHLFLSNYLVVPVAVALMLRLSSERPPFFEHGRLRLAHPGIWLGVVLLASTSIYYAFFGGALIACEGVIGAIAARRMRPAVSALLTSICLGLFVTLALTLSFWHRAVEGRNPAVASRSIVESDIFALRPLHLLLPFGGHRFEALSRPARTYNAIGHDINENRTAALGLIGAAGFILLLGHALSGNRLLPDTRPMAVLARLNIVAVLMGVAGGGGTLIAVLVSPQFRSHNRISVYIAFFSIAAVMTAVDRTLAGVATQRRGLAAGSAAVLLASVALIDQPPGAGPEVGRIARTFESDRAFVTRVEQQLPKNAMVYQAPYTGFPETEPHFAEPDYSPLRLYIHSRTLRWSYGGMKGRPGHYWNRAVERLPMAERVALLQRVGFSGIVLDREAFPDQGHAYEAELASVGEGQTFDSADGTLAFHALPSAIAREGTATFPLLPVPGRGFLTPEGAYPNVSSWTSGNAEALVYHFGLENVAVEFSCALRSPTPRRVSVTAGDGARSDVSIADAEAPIRLQWTLHPGWNVVRFETDEPLARLPPPDSRRVAFAVRALRVEVR